MKSNQEEAKEIIINILAELKYNVQFTAEKNQEAVNYFEALLVAGESKEEVFQRHLKTFREFPCSEKFLQHNLIRFISRFQVELEMKEKPEEAYVCFRPGSKLGRGFIYSVREASSSTIDHIDYQIKFPQKYKDPVFLCFFMPAVGEGPNLLSCVGDRAWPFIKAVLSTPLSEHELKVLLSPEGLTRLRTDPRFIGSAEQIKAFIAREEEKCVEARALKPPPVIFKHDPKRDTPKYKRHLALRLIEHLPRAPGPREPLSPGVNFSVGELKR